MRKILLSVFILTLSPACFSQVYKCTDTAGKVSYQSIPCTGTKQDQPVILKNPTLTNKEKFNAAAYAAGTTPEEARRQIEAARNPQPTQGQAAARAEQPAQAAQGPTAYRCTMPDGTGFVSKAPCPKRGTVTIPGTTVTGVPVTGQLTGNVQQDVISKDQACVEAKRKKAAAEAQHRAMHRDMPADFKKGLENEVRSVCG